MTLNPQQRVDDANNLDTMLPSGRTVRQAIEERIRREAEAEAERRRVAALDEAIERFGGPGLETQAVKFAGLRRLLTRDGR